jgi:hypothetical protein
MNLLQCKNHVRFRLVLGSVFESKDYFSGDPSQLPNPSAVSFTESAHTVSSKDLDIGGFL